MIDVLKRIANVMKRLEFSETDEENKAARNVLAELKTKYVDYKEVITAEFQYKILNKMKTERLASINEYEAANRSDLAHKERCECNVIVSLIDEIKDELPKMMSDNEIANIIKNTIQDVENPNMGMIMKAFKDIKNVDKKLVSEIAKILIEEKRKEKGIEES